MTSLEDGGEEPLHRVRALAVPGLVGRAPLLPQEVQTGASMVVPAR